MGSSMRCLRALCEAALVVKRKINNSVPVSHQAARLAPTIKKGFYTVLSSCDCVDEIRLMLESAAVLAGCFTA